jgi:hypothetical protein
VSVAEIETCAACAQQKRRADSIAIDLDNAEVGMRALRREVARLKGELAKERKADPNFETAERVYLYWKERLSPRSRAFGEDRQKAVLARLNEGYTELELKKAVEGAKVDAYTDAKGKTHNDLELICRSDRMVRRFITAYEAAVAERERTAKLKKYVEFVLVQAELYGIDPNDEEEVMAQAMHMMEAVG